MERFSIYTWWQRSQVGLENKNEFLVRETDATDPVKVSEEMLKLGFVLVTKEQWDACVVAEKELSITKEILRLRDIDIKSLEDRNKCLNETIEADQKQQSDARKVEEELLKTTRALVAVLSEEPINGEYVHLVTCSGDRSQRPGTAGISCSCMPKTRQIEEELAGIKVLNEKLVKANVDLARELTEIKEERDRYREALEHIASIEDCGCGVPCDCHSWWALVMIAREAIAGKEAPVCVWTETDEFWATECGNAFTIESGTPTDNKMAFCCYCGRKLVSDFVGNEADHA